MLRFSAGALFTLAACAQGDSLTGGGGSGASTSTGASHEGGSPSTGGSPETGGSPSTGGSPETGGSPSTGGGGEGGAGPGCGNGTIDAGEDCDGTQLGGATCASQGFASGTLHCAGDCSFDTSACQAGPTCGNNAIEGAEMCDGTNLNGHTCQTQGFSGGNLACNGSCSGFVTTGCTTACTPVQLITTNGGFDNGPNGGGWSESSLNFGTPVCDVATCGTGNGTGPQAGTYWAWFGGTNLNFESASVSRSVVIPNSGMASLSFYFDLPSCEDPFYASDSFQVTVDGTVVFSKTNSDAGCGVAGWELVTISLNSYANGASHTIAFTGTTDDIDFATNFMVDTVALQGCQ